MTTHHRRCFSIIALSPYFLRTGLSTGTHIRRSTFIRISFCCKALQSKKLTRLKSAVLGGRFFLPWTPMYAKTGGTWTVHCYCLHSIASLHLCKEYLNVVKFVKPLLLQIKYWTLWYMDHRIHELQTFKMVCFSSPCTLQVRLTTTHIRWILRLYTTRNMSS